MNEAVEMTRRDLGISLTDISFTYGNSPVLQSISLSIPKGEIWALIGRSGVGKTTLLQVIAGLFNPNDGYVTVQDRNDLGVGRIKGVVFQDDCLLGWLTVEGNVLFPNHRNATQAEKNRARQIIGEVGLSGSEAMLPCTLSAGMRKRVEFARALMVDSEYLLADEPFGTVDALTRRDLWDLWLHLRKTEPRTGILSTHDPEEAIRLCDVIVPLTMGTPAKVGKVIRVPAELSCLSGSETNNLISNLKQEVMGTLK